MEAKKGLQNSYGAPNLGHYRKIVIENVKAPIYVQGNVGRRGQGMGWGTDVPPKIMKRGLRGIPEISGRSPGDTPP